MNQSGQSSALFKMKKVILQLDLNDDKDKQKAKRIVYGIAGIDSVDMEDKKLTVIGDIDPVNVVSKLRKFWHTEIVSVGPAKEPEKKKDEPKKDEPKALYVQSMEEDPNACVIC